MKADKSITKAWVKAQKRVSRSRTSVVTVIGLASTLTGIVQGWTLAATLAGVLSHASTPIMPMFSIFAIASVVRVGLTVLQELAANTASTTARRRLRHEVIARIFADGPALLRRQHSAALAATIVDRIETLDGYFARWLPAESLWLISQWIVVAAVFWQNRHAGLILAVCCASLPVFQAVFGIATGIASRRQFIAMGRLQTRFLDRVKGIATIVLSGSVEHEAQALAASADDLRTRTMKVLRIAFVASATTDLAMVASLVLIVTTQSHALLGPGATEPAIMKALFAVLMVPEAFASFRALSAAYQDRAHATEAATAMSALGEPVSQSLAALKPETTPHGISVQARDIGYSWDESRSPAISDVSFSLQAGETLVLEGKSGAGKSTLLELLLGFIHPDRGQILLGGADMKNLSAKDIAACISWIGQKPVIFAGTIRENILFARPGASESDISAAVRAAAMEGFLALLPEGLETRIGEGGFGLSGGQAQRIAIARAWLKNAPLLLLDEPTSHLDPATEAEILGSLRALSEGRTVILCSHSAQARNFDGRHLVLDRGRTAILTGDAA